MTARDEIGRAAMALPGWQWMPGMKALTWGNYGVVTVCWSHDEQDAPCAVFVQFDEECPAYDIIDDEDVWPDPDDAATAGCLIELLGDHVTSCSRSADGWVVKCMGATHYGSTLGRACFFAATAIGRWPGGAA